MGLRVITAVKGSIQIACRWETK